MGVNRPRRPRGAPLFLAGKADAASRLGSPREQARVLLSALEGAMLVARSHGDVSLFEGVAQRVFHAVTAPPRRAVRAPVSLRRASRRVA